MRKSPLEVLDLIDPPSRKQRIETYLWDKTSDNAEDIALAFNELDTPLSHTVVLIPIAAEQEAESVDKAMAAYADQTDCDPFTIALLLNCRSGISPDRMANVQKTADAVERATRRYGDRLDIRVATQHYNNPTIGRIRKDLWDGALIVAYAEGVFDTAAGEVIGINHDIDTESMDPHYIRNIQREYARQQQAAEIHYRSGLVLAPRHTSVRHLHPFDTHPNTASGIFWADHSIDQASPYIGYEEGIVLPFTHYAKQGGFDRDSKTYETQPLMKSVGRAATIADTYMRTSPRRYIDRFPQFGYDEIWQPGTFTDVDACRMQQEGTQR